MSGVCKPCHVTRLNLSALRLQWCLGTKDYLEGYLYVYCVSIYEWCMQAKSCNTSRSLCSEAAVVLRGRGHCLGGSLPIYAWLQVCMHAPHH
jgi:hypothetical protein